jgi:hypothetical protein
MSITPAGQLSQKMNTAVGPASRPGKADHPTETNALDDIPRHVVANVVGNSH